MLLPGVVNSQVKNNDIEIGLVTVSPGSSYYEAFGHSAIRVKSDSFDYSYGFGYFDFEDENFLFNFLKGEMIYFLGVQDSEYEIKRYQKQGREVSIQWFDMNNFEEQNFLQELNHLARPENRNYSYDYFENNCTSRIRDLLQSHLGKPPFNYLKKQGSHSLFTEIFPVQNQAWMNLGFSIGFGMPAYKDKKKYELLVFPKQFKDTINEAHSNNKLIKNKELWYKPTEVEKLELAPGFFKTHGVVIVTSALFILMMLGFRNSLFVHFGWHIFTSLIGFFLLFLWFFTEHKVASWNVNLLLFFPFTAFLLINKIRAKKIILFLIILNIIWLGINIYLQNFYLFGWWIVNLLSYYYLFSNHCKS